MKLAIHHREGSFSDRWIRYCEKNDIDFRIVNCYSNDIIDQVKDCDLLLWHHHHNIYKDKITAWKILFALEHSGMKVFPDFRTSWHFDDKVAQKYLLEALDAPLVPSYVFYDKKEALEWAKQTSYPKVFKLKGGAASLNVKLVKNKDECTHIIKKAFGKGYTQFDGKSHFLEVYRKFNSGKKSYKDLIKAFARVIIPPKFSRLQGRERNYAYFQDFIPNDGFDVRVVIIDGKAVSVKRLARQNDFRASGSGNLVFENQSIDIRFIRKGFELANGLKSQCIAIDFLQSKIPQDKIYITEISYPFPMKNFLDGAAGYWDKELNWTYSEVKLQEWMVESLINSNDK